MKNKIIPICLISFGILIRIIILTNNFSNMALEESFLSFLAILIKIPIFIFIYIIAKEISKSKEAALFSLILSIFLPFHIWGPLTEFSNSISVLFLISIIFFVPRIKSKYYLLTVSLPFLYVLFSISGWIILPIIIFYYILIRLEHLKKDVIENYFFFISITGLFLLIFAFTYSGSVAYLFRITFWEILRIPSSGIYMNTFNLDQLVNFIGLLPVVFGLIGAYVALKKGNRLSLFTFSVIGCSFLSGIIIGGFFSYLYFMISTCCLSSLGYLKLKKSLNLSIFSEFSKTILFIMSILILLVNTLKILN